MSIPLDLGWWKSIGGQRRLLTWWSDTGALVLGDRDVIAIVHDEDDLRRRLDDWPAHCDAPGGLKWIASQLKGCR